MSNRLPVLIVGAGPTGLLMACELARHGIHFRIIDKKSAPTATSDATWIQTRTLEIFNHIGLAEQFIRLGNICNAIHFYISGESLLSISLDYIDSIFPFVIMLPQRETEKILTQRLEEFKHRVERSVELVDVNHNESGMTVTLQYADNKVEMLECDWLIACDGAKSTIREKCQLMFAGEDLPEQFIVADAQIDSFMSKKAVHVFFDQGTLFSVFPLKSNNYRITANLNLTHARKIFTEREVIEMTQERAHGDYYVRSVSWISSFWIHGKIVKKMRHGSSFLVGDAAHIHSPAGGQGMNTGLQDAYNLAWKLALVVKGKAKPALLESYQAERHPVVSEIVQQTDRYTKQALFDKSFLIKLRRFERKLAQNKISLSKKVGDALTQLTIHYQHSPIIHYGESSGKDVQPGMRAPNVKINATTQLYHYFQNTKHNILLFTGLTGSKNKLEKMLMLQKALNEIYIDLIETYVVGNESVPENKHYILDTEGHVHEAYHAKQAMVYIIRPDTYIAYYSKVLDVFLIERFLKHYLW